MLERYRRWMDREYSARQRLLALAPQLGLVFVLIPAGIVLGGPVVDAWLGWPPLPGGLASGLLGSGLIVVGASLSLWAARVQYSRGRGTPAPVVPTQELVVDGPYRYSRNPMILGGALFFLGVGLWAGTAAGIAFALAFLGVQAVYIKTVEERELEARFGDAYREYKRTTPFIVPRPPGPRE